MTTIAAESTKLHLGATLVGGLRERRLSLKRGLTDRTHRASGGWAEQSALEQPVGAELSGHGVFVGTLAMAAVRAAFLAGDAQTWSLTLPSEGVWSGPFILRTLDLTGAAEELLTFSIRMTSSGPVTFTPETQ